jgi:hypothetical protein
MGKKLLKILGIIIGVWLLISIVPFIFSPGMIGMIGEGIGEKISGIFSGSQTVGQVTVAGRASKIKVEAIASSTWKTDSLSPVIGGAYEITRLNDSEKPVHVEFAYDPTELRSPELESKLALWKWIDTGEQKFWSPVGSVVDKENHVVSADLTSFSILAVRAPLAAYVSPADVAAINRNLQTLLKEQPNYACGIVIMVDEELNIFENGEWVPAESYVRPDGEDYEEHDCIGDPNISAVRRGTITRDFEHRVKDYYQGGSYVISGGVRWQVDPEKSAIIKGEVKDQKGRPLSGVKIYAEKIKYEVLVEDTVTDDSGKFELPLHSGEYQLTINPSGGDSNKNKNCETKNIQEKFFEFGEAPKDLLKKMAAENSGSVYHHGPWDKSIKLQCAEYYINETLVLPVDSNVSGLRVQGTETQVVVGKLIKPASGGYGWEGIWEVEQQMEAQTKTTGVMSIMGGTISLPPSTSVTRDHYKYQFTLLRGAKAGDTFAIVGGRAGEGYTTQANTSAGTLGVTANGGSASVNLGAGSGSSGANYVDITETHKIIQVMDEDGLILELPTMMANEFPQVPVRHLE